jgi:glycosyltransferase involved in cell wall biosynthesis
VKERSSAMTKNQKLNIFCDYCPFSLKGGIEKVLINDIQNLKDKYDINLFATCDAENCEEKLCKKNSDVNFHIIYGRYKTRLDMILANMKFLFNIFKASRDICFQIVHVHSNKSAFPVFLASKLLKSHLVVTVHFVWPFCVKATLLKNDVQCDFKYDNSPLRNIRHCFAECLAKANLIEKMYFVFSYLFDQLLITKADDVICTNEDSRQRLLRLGVNPNKIDLNRIPVFAEKVDEIEGKLFREKLRISSEEKMVLYAGRLCPEKGLELLISAMKNLPPSVKLVIAGRIEITDKYFKRLSDLIKTLNLKKRVLFVGFLNKHELSLAYTSCDVFVYPTLCYEMFGTSAIEALLFKKPVVASSFGGMAELLRNDRALLVEPNNVSELSKAISKCLFDSSYANKIAANGFNFVIGSHIGQLKNAT